MYRDQKSVIIDFFTLNTGDSGEGGSAVTTEASGLHRDNKNENNNNQERPIGEIPGQNFLDTSTQHIGTGTDKEGEGQTFGMVGKKT